MIARPIAILISSLLAATAAASQTAPRELAVVPDGKMDIGRVGGPREIVVVTGPGGRAAMIPRAGYGEIVAYDSAGKLLPWKVTTGFRDDSEIGYASRAGWIAGTTTMWVADMRYKQVVLIDDQGKVTKSIEYPSWVHPTWAQRRTFPVFASMEPYAVYADETMLVMPGRERSFISTPSYDKSVLHLVRSTWAGSIQRTVTTLPKEQGRLEFRDKKGNGHTMVIPSAARTYWGISSDGRRIAVATPGVSLADSGTILVTMLDDRGDTVFARRYPYVATRIPQAQIDQFNAGIRAVGQTSAEQVRAMAAKQIPLFRSYVTDVMVGYDHSTWVLLKPTVDTSKVQRAMVLDPRGDVVGFVSIPPDQRIAAVSLDHLWTFEIGRIRTITGVIRSAVRATPAPPSRTGKASTSSRPSPRER